MFYRTILFLLVSSSVLLLQAREYPILALRIDGIGGSDISDGKVDDL